MIRIFILLFFSILISAEPALSASSLRIRAGEHAQYSRLVFDWNERVPFNIKKTSNKNLTISFEESTKFDLSSVKIDEITNVTGVKIISETPLKLSIDILADSRTRNFYAGDRLVLDIYNPPGAPVNKVSPPNKKKVPTIKKEKVNSHVYEARKVEQEVLKETADKIDQQHLKGVDVDLPAQTALIKATENTGAAELHVITVTSTKNVGVSSFKIYNNTWVITDKDDFYLKPQLNGPKKADFPKFKEVDIEGGRASSIRLPRNSYLHGQGGGLLWRLVISSQKQKSNPILPIRNLRPQNEVHGGILIWPFKEPSKILSFKEPTFNEELIIVTTNSSKDYTGEAYDFVEFEMLETHVGMAIRSKVDDLSVKIIPEGIEITRPGGLVMMSGKDISSAKDRVIKEKEKIERGDDSPRIYSFAEWQIGAIDTIYQNENIILKELREKEKDGRVESIITLAKMFLSQGYGAEALGYLKFAAVEAEGLETNPDFLALRGAANALAWKSVDAFEDLSIKSLKQFEEINFWRAFVLADLADWQQAYQILPENLGAIYEYPEVIRRRLSLVLAEVALRAGDIEQGEELLAIVEKNSEKAISPLTLEQKSALAYLQGEANRQAGYPEETQELWEELSVGKDPLYRAKAKLALTRLLVESDEISTQEAIDNLESLRYAWRGDQLEASINYWLGRAYFDAKEYIRGLNIMREATTYAPGTNLGRKITEEMTAAFTNLYIHTELEGVSALDAVAIYEQFSELTPVGEIGDKIVEILSERLVEADLLGRAGNMLEHQIKSRLNGSDAARVSVRLAAIRLLDDAPYKAIDALNSAKNILDGLPKNDVMEKRYHEIILLRARAHSQAKETDEALKILEDLELSPDVNRLRADISWKASYWDDAAAALNDVIVDNDISLTRPLEEEDATLILQLSIALNLASDRIALANLREKYSDVMAQTSKSRLFEVVTRPRQNAVLADRDTLLNIVSEVDVFEGFLSNYLEDKKQDL